MDDNLEAAQAQFKRWWFRPDFSQVPFHEDAYIDDLLCQTTENEREFLCYRLFMAQWFWLWHYRTFDRNFHRRISVQSFLSLYSPGGFFQSLHNMDLVWFGVLSKTDAAVARAEGIVPTRYSHRFGYLGLRECPTSARQRCGLFETDVSNGTHTLFKVIMTANGYIEFTRAAVDGSRYPRFYCNDKPYGVWHFQGDIPMIVRNNSTGEELLRVEFVDLV